MHKTNLRKVGGSYMLAVPPALLDLLQLREGAQVGVTIESGRLVIEPQKRPRYTLKELLAACNPKSKRSRQERDWVSEAPAGSELL